MSDSDYLLRLQALDTNTVSDALDFLGLKGATYGIQPLWACSKIVGRASTVEVGLRTNHVATEHIITSVIDAITGLDRVIVVAGSAAGVSCWGDLMANASQAKGVKGTVIDGCSRDIEGSETIGFPVYGRGVTMMSARPRLVQVSSGQAIQVCGVTVKQDDYVVADRCGTVFVPQQHIEVVLDVGERISTRQQAMLQAIRAGRPVSTVMHDRQFATVHTSEPVSTKAGGNPKKRSTDDQELSALFAGLDTPGVSDAMDKLGISGQASKIMPLMNYSHVTVGPAFTVRYEPAGTPPGSVGDFIDDVAEGDVLVIDNGGRTDCTVWGDIMTQYAGLRNLAGTVIDGVCRDVDKALRDEYPLFTTGRWMRTGKDRVQVAAVNGTISVGKVRVEPRDIVVADTNGVVIIPRQRACEVATVARQIEESESKIRGLIVNGSTIAQARAELNYHTLQRR